MDRGAPISAAFGKPDTPVLSDEAAALDHQARLHRIEALADLLDSRFKIFGVRIGLDGLIGLIPGIGDAVSALISSYLILEAIQAGARGGLVVRMVINVLIDALIGAIPVLGDLFDIAFRANTANVKLLHRFLQEKQLSD